VTAPELVAELPADIVITEPGVYEMPSDVYHSDPIAGGSLSSSGARALLPPSTPARFRYDRDNPPETTRTFDFGHAAHNKVLGIGPDLVIVPHDNWRTKAAQTMRDDAHAAGAVPLLEREHDVVEAMAAALRRHREARLLLAEKSGHPERVLVWRDPGTKVMCRAMLDWLPVTPPAGSRMVIPDYKTAASADDDEFRRAAGKFGYHQQAAWNAWGAVQLGLAERAAFVFVVQEKSAPFLVNVVELDAIAIAIGTYQNRQALRIFRECQDTGHWPGYGPGVRLVALPAWIENEYKEAVL